MRIDGENSIVQRVCNFLETFLQIESGPYHAICFCFGKYHGNKNISSSKIFDTISTYSGEEMRIDGENSIVQRVCNFLETFLQIESGPYHAICFCFGKYHGNKNISSSKIFDTISTYSGGEMRIDGENSIVQRVCSFLETFLQIESGPYHAICFCFGKYHGNKNISSSKIFDTISTYSGGEMRIDGENSIVQRVCSFLETFLQIESGPYHAICFCFGKYHGNKNISSSKIFDNLSTYSGGEMKH